MQKLSLIVPAYNEEKRIGKMLEAYTLFFDEKQKEGLIEYELFVVINNTKDNTESVVRKFQARNKRIRFVNIPEGGKGNAVIVGFKDALSKDFDLIGFVDADLATPPEQYWRLVTDLGSKDGAIADRYLPDSNVVPPATFRRIVVGRAFNMFVRAVFLIPFRDTQCGAKLFRRTPLMNVVPHLSMSRWAFDVELVYQFVRHKYRVASVPTFWIDREYSHINFLSAGPWMAIAIIRLRIINSSFKRFVKLYDKFVRFIPK